MNMAEKIFRVLVPMEDEVEFKDGKRKVTPKKVFPGYVLVEVIMDDQSWYVVRNTQGVTGFVGSPGPGEKPVPLQDKEVKTILKQMGIEAPKLKIDFAKGDRAKYFEFPSAVYSMHPFDEVRADGKVIGVSTWIGYSQNEGAMLSLAMIDPDYVEFGREVTLVWGEPDGGTKKPTVEPHVQTDIKAIVSPVPYSSVARNAYADSWRQTGKGTNA